LMRRKTQFTKIRCTYRDGAAVVLLRDYNAGEGGEIHINSESLQGRRILWADYVMNELVKHITPPKGQTEVTDDRHKKVYEVVERYDAFRNPVTLRDGLVDLLDPKKTDFATHRKKVHWFGLPKTAGLITDLVRQYPSS
jgi:hypothetical protein